MKKARSRIERGLLCLLTFRQWIFIYCPRILPHFGESANSKKKSATPCGRGLNPCHCGKEETG
jgi:hypothetical protein